MSDMDGGPAFPIPKCCDDPRCDCGNPGMTIRDFFAGMALMGLLSREGRESHPSELAKAAVLRADALLKELDYSD